MRDVLVQMTSINYMDRCMMKLYRERADRLLKRRQEDVKDQSLEYMPGIQQSLCSQLTVRRYLQCCDILDQAAGRASGLYMASFW